MTRVLMGSARDALPLDLMQANASEDLLKSALAGILPDDTIADFLAPRDDIATFIYALSSTPEGRAFFEWFMDMTLRLPYRVTGASIEQTALAAARREGLNAAGELLLAAMARGKKTLENRPGARQ